MMYKVISIKKNIENSKKQKHNFKKWTKNEEIHLMNCLKKGIKYKYIAETLKRTVVSLQQKAGKLNILPLSLDVSVDVPTNKRDFFGNRIYSQVSKTAES